METSNTNKIFGSRVHPIKRSYVIDNSQKQTKHSVPVSQ